MNIGYYSNAKPAHQVTLTYDFWMGKNPVTQEEFKRVMDFNPSQFKRSDYPVDFVSWHDAVNYCKKLTEMELFSGDIPENMEYRLPTEAEWEFAARGGKKSAGYDYAGSDDLDMVAWYVGNSDKKTHPVGEKLANELGFCDMSGNVYEWCGNSYYYYPENQVEMCVDPNFPVTPDDEKRCARGGRYASGDVYCSVAYRHVEDDSSPAKNQGFRVVLAEKRV